MSIDRDMAALEKTGLFDREKALGREAHEQLLELEGKHVELRKRKEARQTKYQCLYCGEEGADETGEFRYTHKCDKPQVIIKGEQPCPSRPRQIIIFEIVYYKKVYRFKDYESAMLFRRLLWLEKVPIQEAVKDPKLRWK